MREITDLEIELIREEQLIYMPQFVSIRRRLYVGDEEFNFETIAKGIKARITPGFGFWRSVADRFQGITAYNITVPWDTDVKAADSIIDNLDRVFEVRDARDPSTYHTALQLLVDRVSD